GRGTRRSTAAARAASSATRRGRSTRRSSAAGPSPVDIIRRACPRRRWPITFARPRAPPPPRFPEIEPSAIPMVAGRPRLDGGGGADAATGLFELGALLHALLAASAPEVAWCLDGPPPADVTSLRRRAALGALVSSDPAVRFPTAAAAAEVLAGALAPEAADAAAGWSTFRGSAERTGARPWGSGTRRLTAVWAAPVGAVVSSPVVTPRVVVAGAADGRLVWLDRASGRRLHERKLASAVESSPALDGGRLYLGTDDGELVAIDLETGLDAWRLRLGTLVRSSPLVANGRVFVGLVDKAGGALVAVDAAKGKLAWRRNLGA